MNLDGARVLITGASGGIESSRMDSLRSHDRTERRRARLDQLHVVVDLDMDVVVAALIDAIERGCCHVGCRNGPRCSLC